MRNIALTIAGCVESLLACGQVALAVPASRVRRSCVSHSVQAIACIVALLAISISISLFLLLMPKPGSREAGPRSYCLKNLSDIALALENYRRANGRYPPAFVRDNNGRPMHSWRALILPYLDLGSAEEELRRKQLCAQYDFSEPWNGPHNSGLATTPLAVYVCPSLAKSWGPLPTTTSYVAVVGPRTAWSEPVVGDSSPPPDGEILLIVEVADSGIAWSEPKDLTLSEALRGINPRFGKGISSAHPGGANVAYTDGSVHFLPSDISTDELRLLLTGKLPGQTKGTERSSGHEDINGSGVVDFDKSEGER